MPAVPMPAVATPDPLDDLLTRLREARAAAELDPFGDPVLLLALTISRRMDEGRLDQADLAAMVRRLTEAAAADRARRIAAYLGLGAGTDLATLAARLVRPDPADSPVPFAQYRAAVETTRFAAVFTAHPTFSLPRGTGAALAAAASDGTALPEGLPHRPVPPSLQEEFDQAGEAIARGRDALDGLAGALLDAAKGVWPDRWATLVPRPVLLASWVGYDTDGRTDIGWWHTLRLRLTMKQFQLARLAAQLAADRKSVV